MISVVGYSLVVRFEAFSFAVCLFACTTVYLNVTVCVLLLVVEWPAVRLVAVYSLVVGALALPEALPLFYAQFNVLRL